MSAPARLFLVPLATRNSVLGTASHATRNSVLGTQDSLPPFHLSPPGPPKPRKPRRDRKPPVSFSDAELLAVLTLARENRLRDYVMILVTYYHGFRANEIASLKVADIDLDCGTIRIHRGKGSRGGTHDLQAWPDNPLMDERAAVAKWLAERHLYGKKGGAKKAQIRPKKMGQSTEIVPFLKNSQNGPNADFDEKRAQEATYQAAIGILSEAGKASTSLLQRGLGIDYAHSCQLIDRMELEGIVGPASAKGGARKMLTRRQPAAGKPLSKGSTAPTPALAHAAASLPPPTPSEGSMKPTPPSSGGGDWQEPEGRRPESEKRSGVGEKEERLFDINRKHFWRVVNGYCRQAGIPRRKCKAHALKHTLVKRLVRLGHPLNEIQEYVGFVSIETLNWYSRADEEELSERIGRTLRSSQGLLQHRQGSLFGDK